MIQNVTYIRIFFTLVGYGIIVTILYLFEEYNICHFIKIRSRKLWKKEYLL